MAAPRPAATAHPGGRCPRRTRRGEGGSRHGRRPSSAAYPARLGGWLIDFVILFVVYLVLSAAFRAVHVGRIAVHNTTTASGVHQRGHLSVIAWVVQIAVVLLYGALFCGSERGQTLGMMAVSVRAVDGRTGGPIGFWRALARGSFEWLLWVFFFIPWVIDMLFPLWDGRHQTLHDKVSNTVVVKASATPPG